MGVPILEVMSGDLAGRSYEVDGGAFKIGRRSDCDLVLPKRYISRVHAEVSKDAHGGFVVRGLSRKNPVLVRGREVESSGLRDGDEFEVCGIRFRFRSEGEGRPRGSRRSGEVKVRFDDDEDAETASRRVEEGGSRAREKNAPPGAGRRAPDGSSDDEPTPDPDARSGGPIVFGGDVDTTKAPPSKTSKRSASGQGDAKESDDRTDEIDVAKLQSKKSDDPFADADDGAGAKKGDPAAAAARERFLRGLLLAGVAGIVVSALFLARYMTQQTPPKTFERPFVVAPNETKLLEEPWPSDDPPVGRRNTNVAGEPYVWFEDDVARVEWACPHLSRVALFLVTGKRAGETAFQLVLSQSQNRVLWKVTVRGDSPHDELRAARKLALEKLAIPDLKAEIKKRFDGAMSLVTAAEAPGKEDYRRRALHELRRADEAVKALEAAIDRSGQPDSELDGLRNNVERALADAEDEYRKYYHRRRSAYEGYVKREQRAESKAELAVLLRVIADPCDLDAQRFALLLERVWGGRLADRIGCIERAP